MSAFCYLVKPTNSDAFCFRVRVPGDLQGIVGRSELRYSVRTSDPTAARCRALVLGRNVRLLLVSLRKKRRLNKRPLPELKQMFNDLLEQCLKQWLAEAEEDRTMRTRPLTEEELEEHLETLSTLEIEARETLALCDYQRVAARVDELLTEHKIEGVTKDSESYRNLCRELLKSYIRFFEIEQRRAVGDYSQEAPTQRAVGDPTCQPTGPMSPSVEPKEQSPVLSEVIKRYSEEQKRGNRWTAKTEGETQASFALLVEIVGNVPVKTLANQGALRDFKSKLLTLPPNYRKSPRYRDKSIPELLAMAEAGKIEKTMQVLTINKHLTRAASLFKWAVQNGYMDRNPAEGLQIATTKRDDEYRAVFTDEDLKKLFHSRDYLEDTHKHSYRYWLPVLALFTGARLTELCQLYVEDIYTVNPEGDSKAPLWVIDINSKDDKKLKTRKSSRRIVPLHDFLVKDLDFPGYVEKLKAQGHTRLFPELQRRKEGYGKTASKWFGEYRLKCGFTLHQNNAPDEERKDFHSFRHTVINQLKQAGVDESVIKELLGHSSSSITFGRYGKRYAPRVLKEQAVDRLKYEIDLGHLTRSRYTVQTKG